VIFRVSDRRRPAYRRRSPASSSAKALPSLVESLLEGDVAHRRHLREVRSKQRALRLLVTHAGWRAYLELEEAEFERWAHALDRVVRWALARGRRERR
jgi:hypothetical protein